MVNSYIFDVKVVIKIKRTLIILKRTLIIFFKRTLFKTNFSLNLVCRAGGVAPLRHRHLNCNFFPNYKILVYDFQWIFPKYYHN